MIPARDSAKVPEEDEKRGSVEPLETEDLSIEGRVLEERSPVAGNQPRFAHW
jgi:hypothetical protein